jgi:hypothetical protein
MATVHSGGDGKENRNITMHISVFCGASLPHSEQITEAARQLGRAIARGGHTLLYLWTDSSCSWQYYPRHGYEQVGFGRVPEYSTADEEYTYRLFRKNITQ